MIEDDVFQTMQVLAGIFPLRPEISWRPHNQTAETALSITIWTLDPRT